MRIKGYIMLFVVTFFVVVLCSALFSGGRSQEWKALAVRADSLFNAQSSQSAMQRKTPADTTYAHYTRCNPPRNIKYPRHLELNRADSAMLTTIHGIGPTFARRIIEYRKALGGFHSISQLREIKGLDKIDTQLFDKIIQNFTLDTSCILKININFASQNTLESHPYINQNMARRIARATQLKGGYINTNQLINQDIITPREALKIRPYISFSTNSTNNSKNNNKNTSL